MTEWFQAGYGKQANRTALPPDVYHGVLAGDNAALVGWWDSTGAEKREKLARGSPWFLSNLKLISRLFAQAQFQIMEPGPEDAVEVKDHEFVRLLRRPNPFMGRSFLWQYMVGWLSLRGTAYWLLVPNAQGELTEIWPIPSSHIEPVRSDQSYIAAYRYFPSNGKPHIEIAPEFVAYFRIPDPTSYHGGMSDIGGFSEELIIDNLARGWNRDTFEKGAPVRVLISTPPNLNPASFKEVKADIQDQFAEGRRYLVVRSGQIDAKVLGNSTEMEYTEGRVFNREAVDRGMGVPAGLWAKEATRANSDAAESVVIKHTVYPLHCLVAEEITAQVLARYYEEEIYGEFEDIRPEDRELKVQERSVYWKVYTVDEARAEVGLGPHPDPEVGGKLVQGGQPGAPDGTQQEDGSLLIEAPGTPLERRGAAEDLRRWRSIARRMVKAGENPGGYAFESEAIPPDVQQAVRQMLDGATSEDEVRTAFSVADNGHRNAWVWTPDYP